MGSSGNIVFVRVSYIVAIFGLLLACPYLDESFTEHFRLTWNVNGNYILTLGLLEYELHFRSPLLCRN